MSVTLCLRSATGLFRQDVSVLVEYGGEGVDRCLEQLVTRLHNIEQQSESES